MYSKLNHSALNQRTKLFKKTVNLSSQWNFSNNAISCTFKFTRIRYQYDQLTYQHILYNPEVKSLSVLTITFTLTSLLSNWFKLNLAEMTLKHQLLLTNQRILLLLKFPGGILFQFSCYFTPGKFEFALWRLETTSST